MKARYILLFFLLFLAIPFSSAIAVQLSDVYPPGETAITPILGNILEPIQKEDIELRRGHVQVPFEYELKKIDDTFYLYFVVPPTENSYTLNINDVATTVDGTPQTIDFSHNFSAVGNLTDYAIKPPIISSEGRIEMKIFLYEDIQQPITVDFPATQDYLLQPGENNLVINFYSEESGFKVINIGKYSVPLSLVGKSPPKLIFSHNSIRSTVLRDRWQNYTFIITNPSDAPREVIWTFNHNLFEIVPVLDSLPIGESEFIIVPKMINQPIDETVKIVSGDDLFNLELNVSYTSDASQVSTDYATKSQQYYCSEAGGKICAADQTCSGEITSTLDSANCCIGECTSAKKTSYAWIGYLIGAVVLVVLVVVGGRYMKSKSGLKKSSLFAAKE